MKFDVYDKLNNAYLGECEADTEQDAIRIASHLSADCGEYGMKMAMARYCAIDINKKDTQEHESEPSYCDICTNCMYDTDACYYCQLKEGEQHA